jgi:hypothetical protein
MSERDEKQSIIRDAPRLPDVSEGGVDLWQIREQRRLTPAQRLEVMVAGSNNVFKFLGIAYRK